MVRLIFMKYQGIFRITIPGIDEALQIPDLEKVASQMFFTMKGKAIMARMEITK
ncbi:hypothetical protein [Rufibacter immobilis]|uniref:hypothetical protein n=1 Tax=Rufibacter immobilis TaxID=1348778 RepID=UPI00161C3B72|nr:hypothetical protein [Rufibacter immobilis]